MAGRPELGRLNLTTGEKATLSADVIAACAKTAGRLRSPMPVYHRYGRTTE
jgi:hypothetical protein